jgi:hypothetical protein
LRLRAIEPFAESIVDDDEPMRTGTEVVQSTVVESLIDGLTTDASSFGGLDSRD